MKRYTLTAEIQELAVKLHDMLERGRQGRPGGIALGPDTLPALSQLNEMGFQLDDGDYVTFEVPELMMALDLATRWEGDDV